MNTSFTATPSNMTPSNMTTIITSSVSDPDMTSYYIRLVADVWISLPMAAIGIMGNIMAFIVLCCYRQRLSTTILLQALTIVDTLLLISVICLRSLRTSNSCLGVPVDYKEPWKVMFRWFFPFMFALRMMDTWLITLLTFDRWIAVCKPLQAQHLCRLGATYKRIIIVIIVSIIFSFPRYLESSQYGIPGDMNPEWGRKDIYVYVYKMFLFFTFMYIGPTAILIVLNLKLLMSLRLNDPELINRRHSKHGNKVGSQSQHRSITIIVLVVVAIYFVCNILAITSQILYSLEVCFDHLEDALEIHRRRISNVSNVFLTFNSASNFFIYCICSKNFRNVMYKTFGCRGKIKRITFFRTTSRTSYSNGTLDTSSSLLQFNSSVNHVGKYVKQSNTDTL